MPGVSPGVPQKAFQSFPGGSTRSTQINPQNRSTGPVVPEFTRRRFHASVESCLGTPPRPPRVQRVFPSGPADPNPPTTLTPNPKIPYPQFAGGLEWVHWGLFQGGLKLGLEYFHFRRLRRITAEPIRGGKKFSSPVEEGLPRTTS